MTPHGTRDGDDAMAVRVREALQARADQVRIAPDALARIRTRTVRRRRRWTISLAAIATTAATAATIAVVAALGGGPSQPVPPVPPATQRAPDAVRLPIYYVARVGGMPVLYREFHPAAPPVSTAPDTLLDRIRAAVVIMLAGQPFDPDYGGDWPDDVSVSAVSVDSSIAAVDLVGTMPTATAGATALQQLVWTVTAVAADRGVHLDGVLVRHDGLAWNDAPLTRGPALETLAPVWLISPQQGDTMVGLVDVHIAAVRDVPVRLRVRDSTGRQLSDDPVTIVAATPTPGTPTGAPPTRGEAHVRVVLAPGRYTLEAYLAGDGAPVALDNHTITVAPATASASGSGGSGG